VPVLVLMARFGRHLPPVLALPLYVLGVFAIAQLSWRYLEPPFRGWRARSPNVHGADATVLVAERSAGP
jgi:peptidoglycan/LPS O-acetylase OafA/YrhL